MILQQIQERLPKAEVYLVAFYPVNEVDKVMDNEWGKHMFDNRNNKNMPHINQAVSVMI